MPSTKRDYNRCSKLSAFNFSRNVRARLCLRSYSAPKIIDSRSILRRNPRYSTPTLNIFDRENEKDQCEDYQACKWVLDPVKPRARKNRIRFHQKVLTCEIPSRHEYSEDEKARMWSSLQEIHQMARRNKLELVSEKNGSQLDKKN